MLNLPSIDSFFRYDTDDVSQLFLTQITAASSHKIGDLHELNNYRERYLKNHSNSSDQSFFYLALLPSKEYAEHFTLVGTVPFGMSIKVGYLEESE